MIELLNPIAWTSYGWNVGDGMWQTDLLGAGIALALWAFLAFVIVGTALIVVGSAFKGAKRGAAEARKS